MPYSAMKRDSLLVLLTLGLAVWVITGVETGFPLDDSWIHQVYARNLAEAGEWAFLRGVPSTASTSPLYTVLLAMGYALGVAPTVWAHLLGVTSLALTGVLVAHLAQAFAPLVRGVGTLAGVLTVMTWHLLWAAGAGMETPLFTCLTVALVWLAHREVSAPQKSQYVRAGLWGALAGLTFLARPEGVALVGLLGLALLFTRPQAWRWGVVAGVCALSVVSPYLWLNWQITGGLLPNTASAKFAQQAPLLALPLHLRYRELFVTVMAGGQALLLPAVLFALWGWRAHAWREKIWLMLPLFWAFLLLSAYAWRLPAPYHHARYIMPVLPFWAMLGAVGLLALLKWGRFIAWKRILTRVLFGAVCVSMAFFALVTAREVYRVDVRIVNEEMVATANWLRENVAEDALIAVHDIGAVGYFSQKPRLLDIAGLVDAEVVPIVRDGDALWALLEARGAAYLVGFPDQLPNYTTQDPRLCRVFISEGATSRRVGGPSMAVYRLSWDKSC